MSCEQPQPEEIKYGTLSVSVDINNGSYSDEQLVDIVSYEISAVHSSGSGSVAREFSGDTISLGQMREGSWQISIKGKSSDGTVVAKSNTQVINIASGIENIADLKVEYLPSSIRALYSFAFAYPVSDESVSSIEVEMLKDSKKVASFSALSSDFIADGISKKVYWNNGVESGQYRVNIIAKDLDGNRIAYSTEVVDLVIGNRTEKVFTISEKQLPLPAPEISFSSDNPMYGDYVTLSTKTPNATVFYTLDGRDPIVFGDMYLEPVALEESCIIKAVAVKTGYSNSAVVSSDAIRLQIPAPVFSVEEGVYYDSLNVSINSVSDDISIYYTLDGSIPTEKSLKYTGYIKIDENTKVRAKAFKANCVSSAIAESDYKLKVKPLSFSLESGNYTDEKTVEIITDTKDVSIFLTIDGTTPNVNSFEYDGPFIIDESVQIKAIGMKKGFENSDVATAVYSYSLAKSPEFSLPSGEYFMEKSVEIIPSNADTSILYTIDGSSPLVSGIPYSGPISIDSTTVIKAVEVRSGWVSSPVATADYTFKVAPLSFSVKEGEYNNSRIVRITTETKDAAVYYTLDGSIPSVDSFRFSGSIAVDGNSTIRAIGVKNGYSNSDIAKAEYAFKVAPLSISVASGEYTSEKSVSISSTTSGIDIYYTLDGTEPSSSSNEYVDEILIDSSKTLKAIGVKDGYADSAVLSAEYSFKLPGKPVLSLTPGSYSNSQVLKIDSSNDNTLVLYTLDGSDPLENGIVYSSPVSLNENASVKAIEAKDGWKASAITSGEYKFKVSPVIIDLNPGTYYAEQNVKLATDTDDADIYYTLDGADPSVSSLRYSGNIEIKESSCLKAIAIKNGYDNSSIASADYSLKNNPAVIKLPQAIYNNKQVVSIENNNVNGIIYYSLDGTAPDSEDEEYVGPFEIDGDVTVSAIVVRDGWEDSDLAAASYKFKVAPLNISPSSGKFTSQEFVEISSSTEDVDIYYTTDGTKPSKASSKYTEPIVVDKNTTLRAVGYKEGYTQSEQAIAQYSYELALKPNISLVSGEYYEDKFVSLSNANAGTEIYYTLDGSNPSVAGIKYTEKILVDRSMTLRAVEKKEGWHTSPEATAEYTMVLDGKPQLSLSGGTYNESQSLTISASNAGCKVYYTVDGSDPAVSGVEYKGAIAVGKTMKVRAVEKRAGWETSPEAAAEYSMALSSSPSFSIPEGEYDNAISVAITPNDGTYILYTVDGSDPNVHGIRYTGPIEVDGRATVKAVEAKEGWSNSPVASRSYTFKVAPISISLDSSDYTSEKSTTVSTSTEGVTLYYTLDGTTPDENDYEYADSIKICKRTSLRVIAVKDGYKNSEVASAEYTFTLPASPRIVLAEGNYNNSQKVVINPSNKESVIYYTLTGSEPTSASSLYSGPIEIDGNVTVKAIEIREGWSNSPVADADYTFSVSPVSFSLAAKEYTEEKELVLSSVTKNSTIYYTTDGSEPDASDKYYSGPITVDKEMTVKAIAVKNSYSDSTVTSKSYRFRLPGKTTISLASGSYNGAQRVTLTAGNEKSSILYTLNGADPAISGISYSTPITIDKTSTLKVIEVRNGWANSPITTAEYTIYGLESGESIVNPSNYDVELVNGRIVDGMLYGVCGPFVADVSEYIDGVYQKVESDSLLYRWYFDNALVASTSVPEFTYQDAPEGVHTITVEVEVGNVTYSDSIDFTFNPSVGLVFYDVDADNASGNSDGLVSTECGYRYLEAAPNDLKLVDDIPSIDSSAFGYETAADEFVFGYYRKPSSDTNLYVNGTTSYSGNITSDSIGYGILNSQRMLDVYGDYTTDPNSAFLSRNYYYPVKIVAELEFNGFDDWFLPSCDELSLMYEELGNSTFNTSTSYWSSSEYNFNAGSLWSVDFLYGEEIEADRSEALRIRPIRAFK